MIKIAKTDEEKTKVREYLGEKGYFPIGNTEFFFRENSKGEVEGAYGITIRYSIEPLESETKFIAHELFTDAKATLRAIGVEYAYLLTKTPSVIKYLNQHEEVIEGCNNLNEFLIKL